MKKVYLGLGSDLGEREANLKKAVSILGNSIGMITEVSPVYETEPVGFTGSNDFLNMVIATETSLSPSGLLGRLMMFESQMGRVRCGTRNSSRIIDIDILLFGDAILDDEALIVPHPRMHARKFVLVPLNDIAPDLVHPIFGKTINQLLSACTDKSWIRLYKP